MTEQLQIILRDLRSRLEALYGERLEKLILYGSQARGDAEPDSDIDVLVVLRGQVNEVAEIERTGNIMSDLSLQYKTVLSGVWVSREEYQKSKMPLLRNINREGVAI
jgi:uncharacterized protein